MYIVRSDAIDVDSLTDEAYVPPAKPLPAEDSEVSCGDFVAGKTFGAAEHLMSRLSLTQA